MAHSTASDGKGCAMTNQGRAARSGDHCPQCGVVMGAEACWSCHGATPSWVCICEECGGSGQVILCPDRARHSPRHLAREWTDGTIGTLRRGNAATHSIASRAPDRVPDVPCGRGARAVTPSLDYLTAISRPSLCHFTQKGHVGLRDEAHARRRSRTPAFGRGLRGRKRFG